MISVYKIVNSQPVLVKLHFLIKKEEKTQRNQRCDVLFGRSASTGHCCRPGTAKLEDRLGAQPKFPDVPNFPLCWVKGLSVYETCWNAGGVSEPQAPPPLSWSSQVTFQTDRSDCAW